MDAPTMEKRKRRCICPWSDCEAYAQSIQANAPVGHFWKGDKIRLQFPQVKNPGMMTIPNLAMYRAVVRYVKPEGGKKERDLPQNTYLHRHHFPISLLKWRRDAKVKQFGRLLSRDDAKLIEECEENRFSHRFRENSNSVLFLCSDVIEGGSSEEAKYRQKYVQTPMEAKRDVAAFVVSLESGKPSSIRRIKEECELTPSTSSKAPSSLKIQPNIVTTSPMEQNPSSSLIRNPVVTVEKQKVQQHNSVLPDVTDRPRGNPASPSVGLLSENHVSTSPCRKADEMLPPIPLKRQKKHVGGTPAPNPEPTQVSPSGVSSSGGDDDLFFHPRLLYQPRLLFGGEGTVCQPKMHDRVIPTPKRHVSSPVLGKGCVVPDESPSKDVADVAMGVIPSLAKCIELVRDYCEQFIATLGGSKSVPSRLNPCFDGSSLMLLRDRFRLKENVRLVSRLIVQFHHSSDGFQLTKSKTTRRLYYYPCVGHNSTRDAMGNNVGCLFFTIRHFKWSKREMRCDSCSHLRRLELRRKRRVVLQPSRYRPYCSLSPNSKAKLYQDRQQQVNNLRARCKTLVERLKEQRGSLLVSQKYPDARSVLLDAVAFIEKNYKKSQQDVLSMLVQLEVGNGETREECTKHIMEEIMNMSRMLKGQEKQCRFSAHSVHTAMTLFLQSPSAYKQFRKTTPTYLPSTRHLQRLKSALSAKEGGDPLLYAELSEQNKGETVMGHLLVDEIKLKNGIRYNSNTHEIQGFLSPDDFNMKSLYESIFCEEADDAENDTSVTDEGSSKQAKKKHNPREATVYANQWRFRSTMGVFHNGDFFYNSGSLDGNELIRQFIQVVTAYEFIGWKVYGVNCDGGGGNSKFLKLLRKGLKVEGPWADIDSVRTRNPIDPTRYIYLWTCGTHGLKASRNNALRSQSSLSRNFELGGVPFGWQQLIDCYQRDEQRRKSKTRKELPRTDLVHQAIWLDNFTIMNASYAKKIFSDKTIYEMFRYVVEKLNVDPSRVVGDSKHEDHTSQWHNMKRIGEVLQAVESERGANAIHLDIRCNMRMLNYLVAIHGIFIERLLNCHWNLNSTNIDAEKEVLKSAVSFFWQWRGERETLERRKNIGREASASFYLADQTYENMLLTVCGFVAYSEEMIKVNSDRDHFFVPGLHCNTSALEGHFSCVRRSGMDTVDNYPTGVHQENTKRNLKQRMKKSTKKRKVASTNEGNSSYPAEWIGTEYQPRNSSSDHQKTIGDTTRVRMQLAKQGMKRRFEERTADVTTSCHVFPHGFKHQGSPFGYLLHEFLLSLRLQDEPEMALNYQHFCGKSDKFCGFFALSRLSEHEEWFDTFMDESNSDCIDRLCQNLLLVVLYALEEATLQSTSSRTLASFEEKILHVLQEGKLHQFFKSGSIPSKLSESTVCQVVLFNFLKESFFRMWLPNALKKYKDETKPRPPTTAFPRSLKERQSDSQTAQRVVDVGQEADGDVNRCMGWAVMKVKRKYHKRQNGKDGCTSLGPIAMLNDMIVLEEDILGNAEYIRKYYPLDDILRNKGRLTLISPRYVGHLSQILQHILCELDLEVIQKFGKGGKIKEKLWSSLVQSNAIKHIDDILDISERDLPRDDLGRDARKGILEELMERIMKLRVGSLISSFRSQHLKRRGNDHNFRTTLGVLSKPVNIESELDLVA